MLFLLISIVLIIQVHSLNKEATAKESSARRLQEGYYYWLNDNKIDLQQRGYAVGIREIVSREDGITLERFHGWRNRWRRRKNYSGGGTLYETSSAPSDFLGVEWWGPRFYPVTNFLETLIVTNEIIVQLKEEVDPAVFFERDVFSSYRRLGGTEDQFVAKIIQKDTVKALELSNTLYESDDDVVWASPNFLSLPQSLLVPRDEFFEQQWQHYNSGKTGGKPRADAHMVTAWDVVRANRNIIVGVIDGGIQHSHPELILFQNPGEIPGDAIDNDNNGWVDDVYGWNFFNGNNNSDVTDLGRDRHGTAVAGMAAAVGNNSIGVLGSAFGARVLPIKVRDKPSSFVSSSAFAEALYYAAGRTRDGKGYWRGADVVCISLKMHVDNAILTAVKWASTHGRGGLGAPIFAAAGNDHSEIITSPLARLTDTITIGSSDSRDHRALYSNYGPELDALAPGSGVLTTDLGGVFGYNPGDIFTPNADGTIAIEAEVLPRQHGLNEWNIIQCQECSNGYALRVGTGERNYDPALGLSRQINFTKTGLYYVWVRGYGSSRESNGFEISFGGRTLLGASRLKFKTNKWYWSNERIEGGSFTIFISRIGTDTVSVSMRNDGFLFDKLVLMPHRVSTLYRYGPPMSGGSQFVDTDYVMARGTSYAASMAAGVGALLITAKPEITADEVRQTIRETADKVGGVNYDTSGWHKEYGYGRINAHKALTWLIMPALKGVDIGHVSHIGIYTPPVDPDGTHHIESSGSGLGGREDGFHFACMEASGDYDMIVRVNSILENGLYTYFKAGLMMRNTLRSDSKYVGIFVYGKFHNRISRQHRRRSGDRTKFRYRKQKYEDYFAPRWIKLKKRGKFFQGFESPDGITWKTVGSGRVYVDLGKKFFVGLAGTADSENRSTQNDFSNLAIRRVRYDEGKQPGLKAEYFKLAPFPSHIPNLDGTVPDIVRTETALNFPGTSEAWPGVGGDFDDSFASRYTGYIYVELKGRYTFFLTSDDGSHLFLDGDLIIDNNGEHPYHTVEKTVTLWPGYHSIKVEYVEIAGWAGLALQWSGPGFDKRIVSPNALYHDNKLQGYWKLDEYGTEAQDSTGHGYTGVAMQGAREPSPPNTVGFFDTLEYVVVPEIDVSEKAYAMSLWFRTDASSYYVHKSGGLFAVVGWADYGYILGTARYRTKGGPDREVYFRDGIMHASIWQKGNYKDDHEIIKASDYYVADGEWHHVVHTFGGAVGGQKLYVDGKLGAQGNFAYSGFDWQREVMIGHGPHPHRGIYFTGEIAEVKLYDGTLDETEVSMLYDAGYQDIVTRKMKLSNRRLRGK